MKLAIDFLLGKLEEVFYLLVIPVEQDLAHPHRHGSQQLRVEDLSTGLE